MESEVRHLISVNYRPAPAASADDHRPEPVHLQIFNDVEGPALRKSLNSHLVALQTLAKGDCKHCRPAGRLQIRAATISGSVADRIGWLFMRGSRFALRSDHDFLLELDLNKTPLRAEADARESEPCLAPTDSPGYFRLLWGRRPRCDHPGRRELTAGEVRAALTEAVRRHRPEQPPPIVSGPAVSFTNRGGAAVDCVPCVPVQVGAAVPWLAELRARRRPAGWPDDRLLARLDGPLLLVPVGPRADDDRLWRLSFSRPEAALVRALPPSVRYCLMLLKAVRMGRRQRLAAISSYYLKTCVLWRCQESSEPDWQDTLQAMRAVLEMLQKAASDRFLPSFFCREINVLREPTDERLAVIQKQLCYFQENLVSLLHAMLTSLGSDDSIQF